MFSQKIQLFARIQLWTKTTEYDNIMRDFLNVMPKHPGRMPDIGYEGTDMKGKCMRIVVKVGTSTLTRENGCMNLRVIDRLAMVLSDLHGQGHQIILVSSGAIGVGVGKLGLTARPEELRMKQAAAAVGQCTLMHTYDKFFGEYGETVAQILLTDEDVKDPGRARHLENTFSALLEMRCIPVVNENDSVSSAEIETGRARVLGDNDTLSVMVARLCRADLLVLLSDTDGLYDRDPHGNSEARLLTHVTEITEEMRETAGGAGSSLGTGGMQTKLDAAARAMEAGIEMVIANGNQPERLYDIMEGAEIGTRFHS